MISPSLLLALAPALAAGGDSVALKAGTIHLVEGGQVLEGGATVLVEDGKIVAVGKNVSVPAGTTTIDYGSHAVLVPGLVAADSSYGQSIASERTADASLRAIDQLDPYSDLWSALVHGVTTTYVAPARGRLIAGQGAVVKTYGGPDALEQRILASSSGLHGSISAEARRTPGYWEPPLPATVDVGLGVEMPQLPRSAMGAIVALDEILATIQGENIEQYGEHIGPDLAPMIESRVRWRMGAEEAAEIRALLDWSDRAGIPVMLDGGLGMPGASDAAEAIAAAGVPVLLGPVLRGGRDFGKGADAAWPTYGQAAALLEAGVAVALTPGPQHPRMLLSSAQLSSRGGVEPAALLRAITLTPAELLGVADRVGSIAPGKDADFAVFTGDPLSEGTVMATWVGGEAVWKADEDGPVVLEVQELHVGDGNVMRPGQLLMRGGKIVEVGARVAHPPGATVVRGQAAMPGMIDAYGYLGLEGSSKGFSTRTDLTRIVEPGDDTDRRVAQAGVTTVNLGSRATPGKKGSPTMVYRPAAADFGDLVVAYPAVSHLRWSDSIRVRAGEDVRSVLAEAAEYKAKWEAYEKELAEYTPPKPDEDDEEEDDDEGDEDDDEEDDKDKKKDKGPKPVTGVWVGELTIPATMAGGIDDDEEDDDDDEAEGEEVFLRLRLHEHADGTIEGNLRCAALSSSLVEVTGSRDDEEVELTGLGTGGPISIALTYEEDDDEVELEGKVTQGGVEYEVEVEQTEKEYVIAGRTVKEPVEQPRPPRGTPRSPGINSDLEPLRQAMLGKGSVFVSVDRSDEVLECVQAFAKYGIRPVLVGASGAPAVASRIRDHISGILPSLSGVVQSSDSSARAPRNRLLDLQTAGLRVAIGSKAEEGAIELPLQAAMFVAGGMSSSGAVRALTSDAASMLGIADRVGSLRTGLAADVLLLDGPPFALGTSVERVWVAGEEIR